MTTATQISAATKDRNNLRIDYIDGLRGLAILLVLITHAWDFSGAPALSFHFFRFTVVLAAIPAIGYIGVNLFLVLSGFCLAYPFMRNPNYRESMSVRRFWLKRLRRIVPAYYVSILLVFLVCFVFNIVAPILTAHSFISIPMSLTNYPSLDDIIPHLFFIHNLSPRYVSTINGSYWSLALEFQLYLLFPLLLEMFFRWGARRTVILVLLVQLVYRSLIYHQLPDVTKSSCLFVLPDAVIGRMFDFYLGIVAAYLVSNRHIKRCVLTEKYGAALGIGVLLATFFLTFIMDTANPIFDLLWALGFAILVCGSSCQSSMCNRLLSQKPIVGLGVISYSIYLIHQPIIERIGFIFRLFLKAGSAYILLTLCIPIVIMLGLFFFRWVEFPFLSSSTQKAEKQEFSAEGVA